MSDLFRDFRERNLRMGIVVDEYGGTAGLVTLDDVLAEIVGEMVDEFRQTRAISKRKDGTFLVRGQIALDELNEKAGLALSEEESQNLSGLLVNYLGRVPYVGEEITLPGVSFHVLDADHRRIYKLSLKKLGPGGAPGAG